MSFGECEESVLRGERVEVVRGGPKTSPPSFSAESNCQSGRLAALTNRRLAIMLFGA